MTEPPRCAACKRRLKQPTPTGLGPVCNRRLNGTPPVIRAPATDPEPMPGQTELPLIDQPDLWSA